MLKNSFPTEIDLWISVLTLLQKRPVYGFAPEKYFVEVFCLFCSDSSLNAAMIYVKVPWSYNKDFVPIVGLQDKFGECGVNRITISRTTNMSTWPTLLTRWGFSFGKDLSTSRARFRHGWVAITILIRKRMLPDFRNSFVCPAVRPDLWDNFSWMDYIFVRALDNYPRWQICSGVDPNWCYFLQRQDIVNKNYYIHQRNLWLFTGIRNGLSYLSIRSSPSSWYSFYGYVTPLKWVRTALFA